ncbi:MAG: choice-of-anchor D domain-containing protein [Chloroflexi bacterium]|nr:choice-of-anchor D domain-containing protein [Chloroflexota bacterium]
MTLNNVRISGVHPGDPREESDIRYNYNNLNQIICASTKLGGNQPMHHSGNGGVTWNTSSLSSRPGDVRQGDPTIDWTSDGTAWSVTIGISATLRLVLRTFSSPDAGVTWNFDSDVTGTQTAMDKEALWIDHSPSSPFRDNMYLIWHNGGPCFVAVRQGPGGAWNAPLQISGAETTGTSIGSDIKTNAVGDIFAFWPDTGSQNLFVAKSIDGGNTFGAPVTIATTLGSFNIGIPAQDNRRCLIYLSGAAYRTAIQNHVYAVWMDLAGGIGCNSSGSEPGNNVASTCKTRIWFARSTDGGTTWDTPLQLNGGPALNDQMFPRLALDDTTGVLTVVYYDTINDPGRLRAELWTQASYDFGDTWTVPTQVATAQTNETVAGAQLSFQYGDYIGLTGHGGRFFACWTDRRSGGAEEIWGALIPASTLVTAIPDTGKFADVCAGSFADELLTIVNNGPNLLSISNIVSSSPDFVAPSVLSFPMNLEAGSSVSVVIRFQPTSIGPKAGTISIFSNDAASPHTISVSGLCPGPHLALAIADSGNFGHVCTGSFRDEPLILNNNDLCRLLVTGVSSSLAEFHVPQVLSFPLTIAPGNSVALPIRFEPTSLGLKAATITVQSNDPTGPHTIAVSGDAPSGKLAITGSLRFGGVKACCRAERPLTICNVGDCSLHVTSVAFKRKRHHWKLVNNPFPASLHPGSCLSVVVRYIATERFPRSCELEVKSDDPNTPVKTLDVMAYTIWDDCGHGRCDKCHKEPCCCEPREEDCFDEDEDED